VVALANFTTQLYVFKARLCGIHQASFFPKFPDLRILESVTWMLFFLDVDHKRVLET
jgi:hypothetical protein